MDVIDISVAKKYTDDTVAGAGAVAGKPCQIQSITDITGGHRVTFLWVDNSSLVPAVIAFGFTPAPFVESAVE